MVGTWSNDGGTMMLWFAKDGTFLASAPGGFTRGHYKMAKGGNVRMDYGNESAEVVVSVSGEKLNFCQPSQSRCDAFQKLE